METCAQKTEVWGVEIHAGRNAARVRIPRMEFETGYVLLKELLLSEVYRRPGTAWTLDLSEHTDGITLLLAGVLAGLCEEVRRSGCTVKCVGLQQPCVKCQTAREASSFPTERTVRESWIGMVAEPSCLRW